MIGILYIMYKNVIIKYNTKPAVFLDIHPAAWYNYYTAQYIFIYSTAIFCSIDINLSHCIWVNKKKEV